MAKCTQHVESCGRKLKVYIQWILEHQMYSLEEKKGFKSVP